MLTALRATPGRWLDTNTPIDAARAKRLATSEGVAGVMRYVPLPGNSAHADITAVELTALAAAGLQVLLVQHVRFPPWSPAMHDGTMDGATARNFALTAGYPVGCHLFLDLEGVQGNAEDAIRYCDDWADAVAAGGLRPGLYCGYSDPLSPDQLYALPGFDCYWSDAGHRRVSTRGVAIQQGAPITIDGVQYDPDVVLADRLGGLPMVAGMAPDAVT